MHLDTSRLAGYSEPTRGVHGEEFENWLHDKGLSQDTIAKLLAHGFTSSLTLAVMEMKDITAIGVTLLGQRRLLEMLILTLRPSTTKTQACTQLQQGGPSIQGETIKPSYLYNLLPSHTTPYLDIVDFVTPPSHVATTSQSDEDNSSSYQDQDQEPHTSAAPVPICRLYNRLSCHFGTKCKYQHVCLAPSCRGPHPLALHVSHKPETKNLLRQG